MDQTVASVEALGRFHSDFARPGALCRYPWLPATPLDVLKAGHMQARLAECLLDMEGYLKKVLTPWVFNACQALPKHYPELVARFARQPLTLLHGDMHPGNLHF